MQERLIAAFSEIAEKPHLQIHLCCENRSLVRLNADAVSANEMAQPQILRHGRKITVVRMELLNDEQTLLIDGSFTFYHK